jgi:hypothetical protein
MENPKFQVAITTAYSSIAYSSIAYSSIAYCPLTPLLLFAVLPGVRTAAPGSSDENRSPTGMMI